MAGLLDAMMQGYTQKVLGSDSTAAKGQAAAQTADAYQRLQQAISNDYASQKQQFESDPANKGKTWQAPDTTERFNDQVQAMIYSGDPNLQARGLQLLDQPKADETTNLEKTAKVLGLDPMTVFQMLHPGPAQTRVSVNIPKQDQPMSFEDAQKLDWSNVPGGYQPGMSMMDAGRSGARLAMTKDQAESGATAAGTSEALGGMQAASSKTTSQPIPAAVSELRNQPTLIGNIVDTAMNAAKFPQNPADVRFITRRSQVAANITRMMSGASASDQDVARVQNMLPKLTDDATTRETKFKAAMDQAQIYTNSAKQKGGVPSMPKSPNAPAAPKATKRYNKETGQLEVIK